MMCADDAENTIRQAIARSETAIIVGKCTIDYTGRITSSLGPGERIMIIKADRSVVVHQPKGVMPVNYMKERSEITISSHDGLTISVSSIRHKEVMHAHFTDLRSVFTSGLFDAETISLSGTERDMADMILENPLLIDPSFAPLSREEHTRFGFIDVFGHDRAGNLVIVECKRVQADYPAVMQLKRYVDRIAEAKGMSASSIRGIIAAPSISSSALEYARTLGYEFRTIDPPERAQRDRSQASLESFK